MGTTEEMLRDLVHSATVWIHSASQPGEDGPRDLWGSGFFVAPGKVLTCSHIFLRGKKWAGAGTCGITYWSGARLATTTATVRHSLPEFTEAFGEPGSPWGLPDLAVLELTERVDHPCVWLSDLSTRPNGESGRLLLQGFAPGIGGTVADWTGDYTVAGAFGPHVLRLSADGGKIEPGASGGPVVDLKRGAATVERCDGDGGAGDRTRADRARAVDVLRECVQATPAHDASAGRRQLLLGRALLGRQGREADLSDPADLSEADWLARAVVSGTDDQETLAEAWLLRAAAGRRRISWMGWDSSLLTVAEYFGRAAEHARAARAPLLVARSFRELGEVQESCGRPGAALDSYREALTALESAGEERSGAAEALREEITRLDGE